MNLTFLNQEHRGKVQRWKIAIQEYDFDIEFLPGTLNVVADGFSRLVSVDPLDKPDLSAESFANVLLQWVGRYGAPAQLLSLVQRIMNAEQKDGLGVSPAQLLFGNALQLDKGILLPHVTLDDSFFQLSPSAVANRDDQLWVVDEILS